MGAAVARPSLTFAAVLLSFGTLPAHAQTIPDGGRTITERMWHLGDDETPNWDEASPEPEGTELELTFQGRAFDGPGVLVVRQRSVDNVWHVEINGDRVATLRKGTELVERFYELPPDLIREGENVFRLIPESPADDVTVGGVRYFETSVRDLFQLRPCTVRVTDKEERPLPARITVVDAREQPGAIFNGASATTATRPGVVYTSEGQATFELPAGRYEIYASRGTEWSVDRAEVTLDLTSETPAAVALVLERELDTTGFVAADTHVHTLTFSGHGDASVEERLVTLAGEGVELAIATDHNHNTDYRPLQEQMGLTEHFTPVVGNEITTDIGHFNAFPLRPDDELPLYQSQDVVAIVADARAKGALAVILNHPRWPDHERGPHGTIALDTLTGDWTGDWGCAFDAVELINSETEEPHPMSLFRDWFALLNRGEKVVAVASSDSHAVGEVVGQGRTYVQSATDVPAELDVDSCARNIAAGRSSISMGIFVDLRREGRSVLGEAISPEAEGSMAGIDLRIAAPSWVQPETLMLFANGVLVQELQLNAGRPEAPRGPYDVQLPLPPGVAWPNHDFWFVAVVRGPGVGPWWPQRNEYTLAATNPVFIDVDRNGRFECPRELAERMVEESGTDPETLASLMTEVDGATALQLLRLARRSYLDEAEAKAAALAEQVLPHHPSARDWIEAREAGN